jgi:NAD(P)-dependent dehydrogenase (short-subunit alcohol dehydrogenase family)
MLAGLCHLLTEDGWQVTVVGRDEAKLARAVAGDPRLRVLLGRCSPPRMP